MNKNAIKKYAIWARTELIKKVSEKAEQYGVSENEILELENDSVKGKILNSNEIDQRNKLIIKIKNYGYTNVIEEVAYTWFNRFIALRFMEVNNYLPYDYKIFTDSDNNFKPQILTETMNLNFDSGLKNLNEESVFEFIESNDKEGLYKYLLIKICNDMGNYLPGMFTRISDYKTLLFPENLLRSGSVLEQMINLIDENDWKDAVQIIGWLYQYYNSELKAEVDAEVKKGIKVTKENLPAKTQLFTPDWIVKYMVENSLGRLWIEGHPSNIKDNWKYYVDEAKQEEQVEEQLRKIRQDYSKLEPKDIKIIDPCMGSGHILVYAFDVLMQIYTDYGYRARDAVKSIIENNIYGLDIDERATQLAYFAIMMKAMEYDSRFLKRKIKPNLYEIKEVSLDNLDYFNLLGEDKDIALRLYSSFVNAKEYGSIIEPNVTTEELNKLESKLYNISEGSFDNIIDIARSAELIDILTDILPQARILTTKYHVVITNPPYLGNKPMNTLLSNYLSNNYDMGKMDLSTVFLMRGLSLSQNKIALVTPESWMFLVVFNKLRDDILNNYNIETLAQLGKNAFDSGFGTCAFVLDKNYCENKIGNYIDLKNFVPDKINNIEIEKRLYKRDNSFFLCMPNKVLAYWCPKDIVKLYSCHKEINYSYTLSCGIKTGRKEDFIRLWFEVPITEVCLNPKIESLYNSSYKWFKYNKGGGFKKWYGNMLCVINLQNNAKDIKETVPASTYRLRNPDNYFKKGIMWPLTGGDAFSCRLLDNDVLIDVASNAIYIEDEKDLYSLMGYMNTNLFNRMLNMINPTVSFPIDTISKSLDLVIKRDDIINLAKENVDISRKEWNQNEISWNFKMHPLINYEENNISTVISNYKKEKLSMSNKINNNEDLINDIYNRYYNIYDKSQKKMVNISENNKTIIASFISYSVGCMFGRYSLDEEGLVYADGAFDISRYQIFEADKDNILPICDQEYFDNDIVSRFVEFVRTVYGQDALEENLNFIAGAVNTNGSTSREKIRNYFINDFFKDHCQTYSATGFGKRPIYWLFDSGKKNGFKALIYIHRYEPDLIARMRTEYILKLQATYRNLIAIKSENLENVQGKEKVRLNKEIKDLKDQAEELRIYEEKIHHAADQMIEIDLDDGVKHNYALFGDLLAKI
ncbi:MAG: BREX-1 system adenine-specific DNA-methyltransferase PglX [Erysipelotrichaceae bacterium]|nr:BREX-1 system adenine-specific DNA-methyltransferase PglX [Erysipelotrichaceae bacterium]